MNDIDTGAAADRAHEILLDTELGVTPAQFQTRGPAWVWDCPRSDCNRVRTTACKPAGCGNDLIDRREFKAGVRGLTVNDNDNDFADGWDE